MGQHGLYQGRVLGYRTDDDCGTRALVHVPCFDGQVDGEFTTWMKVSSWVGKGKNPQSSEGYGVLCAPTKSDEVNVLVVFVGGELSNGVIAFASKDVADEEKIEPKNDSKLTILATGNQQAIVCDGQSDTAAAVNGPNTVVAGAKLEGGDTQRNYNIKFPCADGASGGGVGLHAGGDKGTLSVQASGSFTITAKKIHFYAQGSFAADTLGPINITSATWANDAPLTDFACGALLFPPMA